jgi:hypothetical protein
MWGFNPISRRLEGVETPVMIIERIESGGIL